MSKARVLKAKEFNKEFFDNTSLRVLQKWEQLCLIQKSLTGQPSDENVIQLEKIVKMEYIDLLKAEEAFYRDKGRVEWLRAGDKNTKYFHRQVANHTAKNRIVAL